MNKASIERSIVVVLFVLVIIVFSFAERDTKKLDRLYARGAESFEPAKERKNLAEAETRLAPVSRQMTSN